MRGVYFFFVLVVIACLVEQCNCFLPIGIEKQNLRFSWSICGKSVPMGLLATLSSSSQKADSHGLSPYLEKQPTERIRKGSVPEFNIEGDSITATWDQKALLYTHFSLFFLNLLQVALALVTAGSLTQFLLVPVIVFLSVVLGDLGTGIFHWSVDNYGSLNTPIFGPICVAFQGHHQTPWTITFRPFANNVYKIAIATIPFLTLLALFPSIYFGWKLFLTLFINFWLLSQELHKYAHMKPTQLPLWIQWLQKNNFIISRKEHGLHHLSPFEGHYCIVNGMNNEWLDSTQFFRYLEKTIFLITGMIESSVLISC